jgi:hypothetical protein
MKEAPSLPFSVVATDLFHIKDREYLVLVDLYSNFIEVDRMTTSTADDVIYKLKAHFARYGIPDIVYSDNGPQYNATAFAKFAQNWKFQHKTSSPGNSQSNGAAEAAVKSVKAMMVKCLENNEDPYIGLLSMRNTPTEGLTTSPSQRLLGRRTQTTVPMFNSALLPRALPNEKPALDAKSQKAAESSLARKPIPPLQAGDTVRMQPTQHGQTVWQKATVTEQISARSYKVRTDKGSVLTRNRRLLRKTAETRSADPLTHEITVPASGAPTPPPNSPKRAPASPLPKPPDPPSSGSPVKPLTTTRCGRAVKAPDRFSPD